MARAQAQASGLEGKELGKHQHKLLIAVGKERARQCASLPYQKSCQPIARHTYLNLVCDDMCVQSHDGLCVYALLLCFAICL